MPNNTVQFHNIPDKDDCQSGDSGLLIIARLMVKHYMKGVKTKSKSNQDNYKEDSNENDNKDLS